VALDHVRVADARRAGITSRLAQRTALAKEIPALIEADLDRFQPVVLVLAQASARAAFVELLLLRHESLDAVVDLLVFISDRRESSHETASAATVVRCALTMRAGADSRRRRWRPVSRRQRPGPRLSSLRAALL